jgi:uncharacterized protein with PQ loop repeat
MLYTLSTIIFIVSFSSTLPQLAQTLSTGTTRDFNLLNLVLNLITNLLLSLHGYNIADTSLMAIGIWFSIYWGILLGLKWRNARIHASAI